jgi:hypothetical protein
MLRLTRVEYNNTVRDLLRDTTAPARQFVADGKEGPFDNNTGAAVTALVTTQYRDAAEQLAASAVRNVDALTGCDRAAVGEEGCAQRFVARFGRQAYRRPLAASEQAALVGLYRTARGTLGYGYADAIRVVVQTILQSRSRHSSSPPGSRTFSGARRPTTRCSPPPSRTPCEPPSRSRRRSGGCSPTRAPATGRPASRSNGWGSRRSTG